MFLDFEPAIWSCVFFSSTVPSLNGLIFIPNLVGRWTLFPIGLGEQSAWHRDGPRCGYLHSSGKSCEYAFKNVLWRNNTVKYYAWLCVAVEDKVLLADAIMECFAKHLFLRYSCLLILVRADASHARSVVRQFGNRHLLTGQIKIRTGKCKLLNSE